MPEYSSHLIFNFLCLSGLYILYVQHPFLTTLQLSIFIIAYFAGTVFLTPDMDTKSEASRRCGAVCTPYRKIFAHRKTSHHWLWGVVTRIIYLLLIMMFLGGVVWALGFHVIPDIRWLTRYPFEVLAAAAGLFIANLFHILLDAGT